MPLKLLQHKSYHPYKAENIARVERDKAKAAADEEERDRRQTLAESEARLDRLRGRVAKSSRREDERAEAALLARGSLDDNAKAQEVAPKRQHINFWSEQEAMSATPATDSSSTRRKPSSAQDPTKMYLAGAADGWYAVPDLLTEAERTSTIEASLERAYKDGRNKQRSDPLNSVQQALQQREARKLKSQPHQELGKPWGRQQPSGTSLGGGGGGSGASEAASRGSSERDRARALLLKKKRDNEAKSEISSTVTSLDYQRDMYNPQEAGWAQSARRGGGGGWIDRKRERDRRQNAR